LSEVSGIIIFVNTPELALPDDYPHLLADLKAQIRSAQWTAARVVNTQLIELYWGIGKAILDRQKAEGWGTRVIDRLSDDLRAAYPDMRGLSRSNIHYMRQMAAAWSESAVVPQPVGQLPWGHVRVLLDKLDEPDARDWYALAAVAGGWSRNVLLNQIKGRARDRAGAAPSNFELTLAGEDSELAAQIARTRMCSTSSDCPGESPSASSRQPWSPGCATPFSSSAPASRSSGSRSISMSAGTTSTSIVPILGLFRLPCERPCGVGSHLSGSG